MDITAYISSGILEAYLLGTLSEQEAADVAANIAAFPELALEMGQIEEALLVFAQANAVVPPPGLEEEIWRSLAQKNEKFEFKVDDAGDADSLEEFVKHSKTMPLGRSERQGFSWRMAAVFVALIGSASLNAMLWMGNQHQNQDIALLKTRMDSLQVAGKNMEVALNGYNKGKNMMADTGMQTIVMHTVLRGHPMAATLFWSRDKAEAYVMMDALPVPPAGMQYQLWAIMDGKPVDMGVLPLDMASTASIQKVSKSVPGGEGFAISLEKMGGSPVPTQSNIYVYGKS